MIGSVVKRILAIVLFVYLFFAFFLTFALLKYTTSIYDQSLFVSMFYFRSPEVLWGKARLDYIGFCVPLFFSLLLIFPLLRLNSKKTHWIALIILAILLTGSLIYSLFVHELRYISSSGGGINLVALFSVLGFLSYLIYMGAKYEGVYISFILGYLIGAISDLESLTHTSLATTYGAGGIFDADFILPVTLSLAYLLMLKMKSKGLIPKSESQPADKQSKTTW